jgi:hypothetical protein
MDKAISRQLQPSRVFYFPSHPGHRAVFLAEARNRKEMRQIRELFDMVGQLAQVVPISHGAVMSYAVQAHHDASLFGKIEWLLKTQFTFSLVERNFSDVTFNLVRSLCDDSNTQVIDLPECGVCGSADPFPTRATIEWAEDAEALHLAYCSRCSARYAEEDPQLFIRKMFLKDHLKLRIGPHVPVVLMPEMVDETAEWDAEVFAAAG